LHALHSLSLPCAGERANILKNNYKRKGRIMKRQLLKIRQYVVVILFFSDVGVALVKRNIGSWSRTRRHVQGDRGRDRCRPFKTMEQAEERPSTVHRSRAKPQNSFVLRKRHAEPMRRQHQQREELQQQHLKQQQTRTNTSTGASAATAD